MAIVTKYFSIGMPVDFEDVVEIARKHGLDVDGGKPGFVAWYCLKMKGAREKIRSAVQEMEKAGIEFERRKPLGAYEMGSFEPAA